MQPSTWRLAQRSPAVTKPLLSLVQYLTPSSVSVLLTGCQSCHACVSNDAAAAEKKTQHAVNPRSEMHLVLNAVQWHRRHNYANRTVTEPYNQVSPSFQAICLHWETSRDYKSHCVPRGSTFHDRPISNVTSRYSSTNYVRHLWSIHLCPPNRICS